MEVNGCSKHLYEAGVQSWSSSRPPSGWGCVSSSHLLYPAVQIKGIPLLTWVSKFACHNVPWKSKPIVSCSSSAFPEKIPPKMPPHGKGSMNLKKQEDEVEKNSAAPSRLAPDFGQSARRKIESNKLWGWGWVCGGSTSAAGVAHLPLRVRRPPRHASAHPLSLPSRVRGSCRRRIQGRRRAARWGWKEEDAVPVVAVAC